MGRHYVPQEYLRGFAIAGDPDRIWMFDKKTFVSKAVPIKNAAQAPGYYDDDVEQQLNDLVEAPANLALDCLRNGQQLSPEHRNHLAVYIAVMLKRVPRTRRNALENIVPKVLEDTINETINKLRKLAETSERKELLDQRLAEVERLRKEYREQPPDEVVDQIRSPWVSVRMLSAVARMTWRIFRAPDHEAFVTSDNPAYFFESYGIGTENSEIVFPVSSQCALHGSFQGSEGESLYMAKPWTEFAREVNRRMVAGAERFVFSESKKTWLPAVAKKPRPYLSHIRW